MKLVAGGSEGELLIVLGILIIVSPICIEIIRNDEITFLLTVLETRSRCLSERESQA